ncbi:MAG: hypothetical protein ABSD39_13335 [Terriglobales bacterium]|jgi:hypothetical protein
MAQISPEVSKLLEQALALSVEEDQAVLAAWDEEIRQRIADLGE